MDVKKILENNEFVFKKKFGQNFLLDENILNNIVNTANINKETLVIEVGVGAAALTRKLSLAAGHVLGYEIDTQLKGPLKEILSSYNNIDIIFDDFLKRNLRQDLEKYNYENIVVVANLPYYITTPIITKFIEEKIPVNKIVVMVQNEVANRFAAKPNSKDYNSLSVFVNYYFNVSKAFVVSRNVFYPRPNVDSAIIVFEKKTKKINLLCEEHFFKLVKQAFTQKRKNLRNNLKNYDLDKLDNILKMIGKDLTVRAENLTIDDFVFISNELNKRS